MAESLEQRLKAQIAVSNKTSHDSVAGEFRNQFEELLRKVMSGEVTQEEGEVRLRKITEGQAARREELARLNLVAARSFNIGERVLAKEGPGTVLKVQFGGSSPEGRWELYIQMDHGPVVRGTVSGMNVKRIEELTADEKIIYERERALGALVKQHEYEYMREHPEMYEDFLREIFADPSHSLMLNTAFREIKTQFPNVMNIEKELRTRLDEALSLKEKAQGRKFLQSLRTRLWQVKDSLASPEEFRNRRLAFAMQSVRGILDDVCISYTNELRAKMKSEPEEPDDLYRRRR